MIGHSKILSDLGNVERRRRSKRIAGYSADARQNCARIVVSDHLNFSSAYHVFCASATTRKNRSVRAIGAGPWRPLNLIVKLQSVLAFAVDRPQPRFEQRVFSVTFFVRNGSSTLTRATPHTFSIDEFFCQCRSFPRNQNP